MSSPIPQGIEVLVKKASVDPQFKAILLDRREAAAESIGLELTAAEAAMLRSVPAAQLEAIIGRTSVPQEHRRAFLGQAAAAMLAALGVAAIAETAEGQAMGGVAAGGVRPDSAPAPTGIRPDRVSDKQQPDAKPTEPTGVESRVVGIVAGRLKVGKEQVTRDKSLAKDLGAKSADLIKIRKEIEKEFQITIPGKTFAKLKDVGETVDHVEKAVADKKPAQTKPAPVGPGPTRGIRPDEPRLLGGSRPQ